MIMTADEPYIVRPAVTYYDSQERYTKPLKLRNFVGMTASFACCASTLSHSGLRNYITDADVTCVTERRRRVLQASASQQS